MLFTSNKEKRYQLILKNNSQKNKMNLLKILKKTLPKLQKATL